MMKQQHSLPIPRPSLKQVLRAAVGSGLGVFGLLVTVALYIVAVLTHPKKKTTRDLYTLSPYEFDLPAEAVTFSPRQGDYPVVGWYIPSPQVTTTILVCPGYRSRAADVLGISAHLWKAGHNVLVFEYYGHGMPVGTAVTLGYREVNDFLGAAADAKARVPQTSLGVLGYSMGAAVAIMCSAWQNHHHNVLSAL
jgi:predicted alpha/beta-fold hydrolase